MGQIKFMSSLLFISLFVIALTTFAFNFALENPTNVSLADDSDFNTAQTNLENNIEVFYDDANDSTVAMSESTLDLDSGETQGGTAFKVTTGNILDATYNAIVVSYKKVFGDEFQIIFTALISMLGLVMVLYLWKAWRGNPD